MPAPTYLPTIGWIIIALAVGALIIGSDPSGMLRGMYLQFLRDHGDFSAGFALRLHPFLAVLAFVAAVRYVQARRRGRPVPAVGSPLFWHAVATFVGLAILDLLLSRYLWYPLALIPGFFRFNAACAYWPGLIIEIGIAYLFQALGWWHLARGLRDRDAARQHPLSLPPALTLSLAILAAIATGLWWALIYGGGIACYAYAYGSGHETVAGAAFMLWLCATGPISFAVVWAIGVRRLMRNPGTNDSEAARVG